MENQKIPIPVVKYNLKRRKKDGPNKVTQEQAEDFNKNSL